ncbi:JmjC domain, hydroxylase-domain-containing protein [Amylocystis lapponica]|nr:JmjC domain, hydroxylase-domain-containing protein [Amylocystis lapponica]
MSSSRTPSLTPSRSPTPEPPIQPDHFYGAENAQHFPPSPDSDGRTWLDPDDDPMAQRGIPVFKPTLDEFRDFEAYMERIECWGKRSGIVKVIPPKEWTDALPALNSQLGKVKLKTPIEQHMLGRGGLFRQENLEKRRIMSVREWAELCAKEDWRAPGVDDIGLHARAANATARKTRRGRRKTREPENAEPDAEVEIKEEEDTTTALDDDGASKSLASPPQSVGAPSTPTALVDHVIEPPAEFVQGGSTVGADDGPVAQIPIEEDVKEQEGVEQRPKSKGKRPASARGTREAHLADRAAKDEAFLETFDPHSDWLPPNTTPFDYTQDFCKELERRYWRNCGLGKPAWYGADMQGSLFTDETTSWNVGHLNSALSRLLPASSQGLPGVNTPYLYFGMWRATFAWHVEDMDLFSINYIHFGAPKFWYAIPQARASALETTMRGYFPKDVSQCPQFLRHKSFLASPNLLSKDSCRPNTVVQRTGEFIITYPMGYHAGFNLGFNCAESVNFALESWLDLGRKAKACECVNFSVRIDVDQLIRDRREERALELKSGKSRRSDRGLDKDGKPKASKKRKSESSDNVPKAKKQRTSKPVKSENSATEPSSAKASSSKTLAAKVTLKLGPKPKESEVFPCCLCVNMGQEKLLRVLDPPVWRKERDGGDHDTEMWMAHEECANVVPETWIDEIEVGEPREDGTRSKERVVFGVDGIVKDRWNLKCSACTKTRHRAHGAPIQCTKGKCPKAFHVSCARDGASHSIVYNVLREVEKEVVLLDYQAASEVPAIVGMTVDLSGGQGEAMNVDQTAQLSGASGATETDDGPRVLKLIKKVEVQVLCSQHNPAIAEAKRALKQDKIRSELLALPTMSRIKLRVSAGVFEVSLIRVIEESSSVEVLWDRGVKREFKWGSVVFGNMEGVTVGQKPTEPAPEPEPQRSRFSFPPLSTTTPTIQYRPQTNAPAPMASLPTPVPATPSPAPSASTTPTPYQPPAYHAQASAYNYAPGAWTYQYPTHNTPPQYSVPGPSTQTYQYGNMPRAPYPPPASYQPYAGYEQQYQSREQQYQSRGLQWQRPYTGPKVHSINGGPPTQAAQTVPYYSPYPQVHGPAASGYSLQQTGRPAAGTSPAPAAMSTAVQVPVPGVPPP